jgi:thioredoxin-like negative regulator of GroEL
MWMILALAMLTVAGVAGADEAVVPEEKLPAAIEWAGSYEAALAAAAEAGKPVMIAMGTALCNFCAKMDHEVLTTEPVIRESLGFICVRVDADHRDDLVTRYKAFRYPGYVFVDKAGEAFYQSTGYMPAAPFAVRMRQAQAIFQVQPELAELQARQAAGDLPAEGLARLGHLLLQAGKSGDARAALTEALAGLAADSAEGVEAKLDLAIVDLRTDRQGAQKAVQGWLAANPDHARHWEAEYERGLAQANGGNLRDALSTERIVAAGTPESDTGTMAAYYAGLLDLEVTQSMRAPTG